MSRLGREDDADDTSFASAEDDAASEDTTTENDNDETTSSDEEDSSSVDSDEEEVGDSSSSSSDLPNVMPVPAVPVRLVPQRVVAAPIITRQQIRDNIISTSTQTSYLPEILRFLFYCQTNPEVADLLTDYCVRQLDGYRLAHPGRDTRYVVNRTKELFLEILQHAHTTPLIHLNLLKADTVVEYLATQRRPDGSPLQKSSYNLRISAISHLCRCHDLKGYPNDIRDDLNNLKRGFFNTLNQIPQIRRRRRIPNQRNRGNNAQDNNAVDDCYQFFPRVLVAHLPGLILSKT